MRILVITSGLYEYFYSLQTELLVLGHEVYVVHFDSYYEKTLGHVQKEKLQGDDCDLVITANIFDSSVTPNILSFLASYKVTCPIISITWGHPVEEIENLWQKYDTQRSNAIIKDLKILLWSPCQKAAKEFIKLGFKPIIYAPLGFSEKMSTLPFFRWIKPEQANENVYNEYLKKTKQPSNLELSHAKIIYLGILPKKPENLDIEIDFLARSLAEESIASPIKSRADMEAMWSYIFSKSKIEQLNIFSTLTKAYKYYHARGTRRVFVHRLKEEFGKHFLLIGDDWIADNIVAKPSQSLNSRGVIYDKVPVSMDFGSTSFETSFFPRPIEIVKNNGCLLSYRRYDSEHIFQDNESSLVFDTPDEMCEKVYFLLNNIQERKFCSQNLQ
ncbi:MAG: hypothetical protein HQL71_15685, partial [Magnetococcales bacterium]|nr:hypothetical protein [Magnetococcales bacterium]